MTASLDSNGSPINRGDRRSTSAVAEQSPSEALYQKLVAEARAERKAEAERRALEAKRRAFEAAIAEFRADSGEDEGAGS
jgi:hypothetical protein